MKPFIVAIAGFSGSGKTSLAREVSRRLEERCALLALDSYYQPQPHLDLGQRALWNYDHPDAVDWTLLESHLDDLSGGDRVNVPVYLFDRHTRAEETRVVEPARVVIVEGILALHHAGIRSRAALKAYVATEEAECLRRRLQRDMAERGRSKESVLKQYYATVQPMAIEYVLPSRHHADVVVSGQEPLEQTASEILKRIVARAVNPAASPV